MKNFFVISGCSLLLFLIVCWTIGINFVLAACIEGLCFMIFTWYCCKKYYSTKFSKNLILCSVILGRLCLEVPVRIIDFWGTLTAFHLTITCLLGIIMGRICYKHNKPLVWIVCGLLLIAYGFLMAEPWINFCSIFR